MNDREPMAAPPIPKASWTIQVRHCRDALLFTPDCGIMNLVGREMLGRIATVGAVRPSTPEGQLAEATFGTPFRRQGATRFVSAANTSTFCN